MFRNLPFILMNCGCHPDKQIFWKETVNQSQTCFLVLKGKSSLADFPPAERSGPTRHQHPSTLLKSGRFQRSSTSFPPTASLQGRGLLLASPLSWPPSNNTWVCWLWAELQRGSAPRCFSTNRSEWGWRLPCRPRPLGTGQFRAARPRERKMAE